MTHWHQENPWKDTAIYVPLETLAEALSGYKSQLTTGEDVIVSPDMQVEIWKNNGLNLDAYILPQPSGNVCVGVRYGPEPSDYISPHIHNKENVEKLCEKYTKSEKNDGTAMFKI